MVTAQEILQKVSAERKQREEDKLSKQKADEFFAKLQHCLTLTQTRTIVDPNTKKWIGMKFKYTEDGYGKNIYDYVEYNDNPEEQKLLENIEVRYMDANDPKDGSWIEKGIDIVWKNKNY